MMRSKTTTNKKPLDISEGKTIIRRWTIDMEDINSISKEELEKIVQELDDLNDDDLEYMGDEEIDDEQIDTEEDLENIDDEETDDEEDMDVEIDPDDEDEINKYL